MGEMPAAEQEDWAGGHPGRQGQSMRLSLGPRTLTQTFTCRDIPKKPLLLPGQARTRSRACTHTHTHTIIYIHTGQHNLTHDTQTIQSHTPMPSTHRSHTHTHTGACTQRSLPTHTKTITRVVTCTSTSYTHEPV